MPMNQEFSAALKAGTMSALPLGSAYGVFMITYVFPSNLLVSHPTFRATVLVGVVLMSLAFAAVLGAVAGLIFVAATNKLPIQSTYIKAVIPIPILWSLCLLYTIAFNSLERFLYLLALQLVPVSIILVCTLLFAYLFNRWSK